VTPEEITTTVDAARMSGAAILISPVTETVKEVAGAEIVKTLERSKLRKALTPQCFQYDLLWRAYRGIDLKDPTLTDDSFVVEQIGVKVTAIEGNSRNIKITTPQDLALAELIYVQNWHRQ
jgi:2-C-methyl-D-erythritol 4-phosphate cytidylyltransferase